MVADDNAIFVTEQHVAKEDEETLNYLLSNHLKYTGSEIAKKILADLSKEIRKFVKVMPC